MTDQSIDTTNWDVRQSQAVMTRSFDFSSYTDTRRFLDDLAELSERTGYYPNLNFNRTQVNVSIYSEEKTLGEAEYQFARATDALLTTSGQE